MIVVLEWLTIFITVYIININIIIISSICISIYNIFDVNTILCTYTFECDCIGFAYTVRSYLQWLT
jgi:hypothetical protein